MSIYQLHEKQMIPSTLEDVWDFISAPDNLKEITPDHMGFEITTPNQGQKMYPGMMIGYKVSPFLHIKMTWVTEITHVKKKNTLWMSSVLGPMCCGTMNTLLNPLTRVSS